MEEEKEQKEVKLPQALEKMLAFKDKRAQQVGVSPEELEKIEKGETPQGNNNTILAFLRIFTLVLLVTYLTNYILMQTIRKINGLWVLI